MTSEIRNFLIKTTIKDKSDNQIKELSKQVDLKIEWKGNIGYLNPEWYEYHSYFDNRRLPQHDHWKSRGEVISFEKDGKKYDILAEFTVDRGWFRDRVEINNLKVVSNNPPFTFRINNEKEWELTKHSTIWPVQRRWEGPILVTIIIVIIIAALIAYVWWETKRKKKAKL